MTWKKLTICLSLCLSFFCSLFVSSSVSALSDLVYDSSSTSPICNNCYSSGYRWVTVRFPTVQDSSDYLSFYIYAPNSSTQRSARFYPVSSFYVFPVLDGNSYSAPNFRSLTGSITFSELPPPEVSVVPTGTLNITQNGTYDVSSYATAEVNVENEVIYGDYHNDLVAINNSILICAAVCLVIYFFYCIYRMIIRSVK